MKQIDPRVNKNLHQLAADIYNSIEHEDTDTPAIELLENYGKWVWNKALDLAAENAQAQLGGLESNPNCEMDKESILKLKIP